LVSCFNTILASSYRRIVFYFYNLLFDDHCVLPVLYSMVYNNFIVSRERCCETTPVYSMWTHTMYLIIKISHIYECTIYLCSSTKFMCCVLHQLCVYKNKVESVHIYFSNFVLCSCSQYRLTAHFKIKLFQKLAELHQEFF